MIKNNLLIIIYYDLFAPDMFIFNLTNKLFIEEMWNSHFFINLLFNLSDLFVPNIFFNRL